MGNQSHTDCIVGVDAFGLACIPALNVQLKGTKTNQQPSLPIGKVSHEHHDSRDNEKYGNRIHYPSQLHHDRQEHTHHSTRLERGSSGGPDRSRTL